MVQGWFGQPVLDPIYFADHVKAHLPRICCVPVARLLGKLNPVIIQDRVDAIGDGLEQTLEELPRRLAIRFINELRDYKFAGPVDAYK